MRATALAVLGAALAGGVGVHAAPAPRTPASSIQCMSYAATPVQVNTNPTPLVDPQDIAVDGAGDLFVVDLKRRQLIRVDATTSTGTVLLGPEVLQVPIGLTISMNHADLYIGDANTSTVWHLPCQTRGSNSCKMYHKTANNITLGTAVHPQGLHIDSADHLYIADFNGHRVLKRDVETGETKVLLDAKSMGDRAPANPFGPHDITVDPEFHEVLVTDITNDDIWSVKCKTVNAAQTSCDVYQSVPTPLELTGSSSNIDAPSGIVTDEQSTIFVTGKKNGIVAEIKGNSSVDLLQEGTAGLLKAPVALTYDQRPTNKSLYIADDPAGGGDNAEGLYRLPCTAFACVALTGSYVRNVKEGHCTGRLVGQSCPLACNSGFYSPNVTSVVCTEKGWDVSGVVCLSNADRPTTTTTAPNAAPSGDAGVAVGVTLVVLVLLGVAVFLIIRFRQGRLIVKTSSSSYTSTFGSAGV